MVTKIEDFIDAWITGKCRKFKAEIEEGCPWLEDSTEGKENGS